MWRDSVEDSKKKQSFKLKDWKETWQNIKKAYYFIKKDKKRLIFTSLISATYIPISIIMPTLTANILLDLNDKLYNDVLHTALIIFLINFIYRLLTYISKNLYQKFTLKINYEIQREVLSDIFNLQTKNFDDNGTGLFIDRLRHDVKSIVDVFDNLTNTIVEVLTSAGIIVVIINRSFIMFLFFMSYLLISMIIERIRINNQYQRNIIVKSLEEKNTGLLNELVRGVRDIKVLNANKVFLNKFENRIEEINEKRLETGRKSRLVNTIDWIIYEFYMYLFFILGIYLISKDLLTPASLVVLYMYRDKFGNLVNYLIFFLEQVKSFNLSANRVFNISDPSKFPKEIFGNLKVDTIKGNIEFRDVHFSYIEEKEILHGIDFKVKENETVAFVGKSGSGKTTIFNLISKLYQIEDNKIFIDGNDINLLTRNSLRDNMAVITQNPYIFNLSIKDNLMLVKDKVTDKEIEEACKIACLDEFIKSLPDGYDTVVGEGGITLSGGERQRLAIARALIKKTNVILLDEATSALDNETQDSIQKALHNLKGKYTILIIAHRLSTIIKSDKIFMIDKGRIIAEGTHQSLMNSSNKYRKLYESELEKEDKISDK